MDLAQAGLLMVGGGVGVGVDCLSDTCVHCVQSQERMKLLQGERGCVLEFVEMVWDPAGFTRMGGNGLFEPSPHHPNPCPHPPH